MKRGGSGAWLSVVGALALFLSSPAARAEELPESFKHQVILQHHIDWRLSTRTFDEVSGLVFLGIGNAFAGLVVASDAGTAPTATAVAGFGALDALAITSIFLPRDDRSRILQSSILALPFLMYTTFALAEEGPRLTFGSLAAGAGVSTVLYAIDNFGTSTRFSTLQADYERLDSRVMSSAELATVHQHVLGMRGPIPAWLRGLPMVAGGIVGFIPVFGDEYSTEDRRWGGIFSGLSILNGGVLMLDDRVRPYERALEREGVRVEAAGAGLRLRGWFSAL